MLSHPRPLSLQLTGIEEAADGEGGVFALAGELLERSLAAEGGAAAAEELLQTLATAAAAPGVRSDARFDAIRALLAAAPAEGAPRRNFASSLLDGIAGAADGDAGVFGQAALLLERALDPAAAPLLAASSPQELLLAALAAEAGDSPRFEVVRALLAAAPEAGEARTNFVDSLVRGRGA